MGLLKHEYPAIVLAVLLALCLSASAAALTPEQLFANDATGVVKINAHCASGSQQGSGFLLGPMLVMTARHVMVDEKGRSCTATVTQAASGVSTHVVRWMALRVKRSDASTDIALALLASPLKGHYFTLSSTSPKRGQLVTGLGYALGQPLSLNQGHVGGSTILNHIRLLELQILEAPGASGGPILNSDGEVVGLTQFGIGGIQETVDLPHLIGGDPRQLCFGVAADQASSICLTSQPRSFILTEDGPPPVCIGAVIDPPFQSCPAYADDALGLISVVSKCPASGAIAGAGFLLGPRLMMTARQLLIDPATGQDCTTTVIQDATGKSTRVTGWTAFQIANGQGSTDVAAAVLAKPLPGYAFTLSKAPPRLGDSVYTITPLVAVPGAFDRDRVEKVYDSSAQPGAAVPQFELKLNGGWSPGGPIVNAMDEVVGIAQWGNTTTLESIDLARMSDGDPEQFCLGGATGQVSTICPARSVSSLLVPDNPPTVCAGKAEDPPFSACIPAQTTSPAIGVTPVPIPAPPPTPGVNISRCWLASSSTADSSQQVSQLPDTTPAIYVVWQLDQPPASTQSWTTITVSPPGSAAVTKFAGPLSVLIGAGAMTTTPNGVSFVVGPYTFAGNGGPVADGVWTYTIAIGSGAQSCSATVTAVSG